MRECNPRYQSFYSLYDMIMTDKIKRFGSVMSVSRSAAIEIFRYALTYYLGWDIYQIRDNLTMPIIKKLRLARLMPSLGFPKDIVPNLDLWYIAHLLEPELVPYGFYEATIRQYEDLVAQKRKRPVVGFWGDDKGKERLRIILQYCMQRELSFNNALEGYVYFATKGTQFLKEHKLHKHYGFYWKSPIDYFHDALPDEEKDTLAYLYAQFVQIYGVENAKTSEMICETN